MTARLAALLWLLALPATAAPARVVSLNLCADQFLLLLAPEQAAAVTFLARDPTLSAMAEAARDVPTVRADAEAVLRLRPSLVLAGPWGARATLQALARRGLPVETVVPPRDFAAIRAETHRLAGLLGVPDRAGPVLAAMDAVLAGIRPGPARQAIALEPRGYTAGPGSLKDAVLRQAGFANAARGDQLGLEALALLPPVLLVLAEAPPTPSRATDLLDHPALRHLPRRTLPPALTVCGGPWTAGAAARLAE